MSLHQFLFRNSSKLISSMVFAAGLTLSSIASASLSENEISKYEVQIANSDSTNLCKLEIKIARFLQENPSDAGANYLMSTLLLKMFTVDPGNFALIRQSSELAAQTFDLNNSSDLSIAALANILETTGETEKGLSLIHEAEKQGIKSGWRTKLAKAKLIYSGSNADVVLRELSKFEKTSPELNELISPFLVSAISSNYSGQKLLETLDYWNTKHPSIKLSLAMANALAIYGQYTKSMLLYAKIDAENPFIAESHLSQGLIAFRKLHNTDLALKELSLAAKLSTIPAEQTAAKTHYALALISKGTRKADSISASLDAVATASEPEPALLVILGALMARNNTETTMEFLNGLETARPGLHLAHALKAETLSEKLGKHKDAVRSYTSAITLEPGRAEYYNGRGLALMNLGILNEALQNFESAVGVNPEDASARYNEACAKAKLGRHDEALESLSKAFDLDHKLTNHAKTDADLASLRSDQKFHDMIRNSKPSVNLAH
jgi:tetratricopeptide (TPR) repeat protein